MSTKHFGKGSKYERCIKAGFSLIELNEDFSKRAVWADEVEKHLALQETKAKEQEKPREGK